MFAVLDVIVEKQSTISALEVVPIAENRRLGKLILRVCEKALLLHVTFGSIDPTLTQPGLVVSVFVGLGRDKLRG